MRLSLDNVDGFDNGEEIIGSIVTTDSSKYEVKNPMKVEELDKLKKIETDLIDLKNVLNNKESK